MFTKKIFWLVTILGLLLNITLARDDTLDQPPKPSRKLNRIVAIVNNQVITQKQLVNKMYTIKKQLQQANAPIPEMAVFREKVLQDMIDQSAELQAAAQSGITVSDKAVDDEIKNIAEKNDVTIEQLTQSIKNLGVDFEQYRSDLRDQMIIRKLIQRDVVPRINITEQDINEFLTSQPFNKNKAAMQYHLKDFLVPLESEASKKEVAAAKQQALQLAANLRAGKQIDQSQFVNDLGWRPLAELPVEFADKVQHLQVGTITDPIEAPNGFHIIKLLASRNTSQPIAHETQKLIQLEVILLKKTDPKLCKDVKACAATDQKVAKLIKDIHHQLVKGKSFASLAKKYSQDASASSGGFLGWVSEAKYPKEIIAVTNKLKSGEFSEPIMTEKGWYIVQVSGKRQVLKPSKEQHREVSAMIFQKKFRDKLEEYVTELRSQLHVKIV